MFVLERFALKLSSNLYGITCIDYLKLFMLYLLFADAAVVFAYDPLSLQSMLKDIEVRILCNKSALKLNVNIIN